MFGRLRCFAFGPGKAVIREEQNGSPHSRKDASIPYLLLYSCGEDRHHGGVCGLDADRERKGQESPLIFLSCGSTVPGYHRLLGSVQAGRQALYL